MAFVHTAGGIRPHRIRTCSGCGTHRSQDAGPAPLSSAVRWANRGLRRPGEVRLEESGLHAESPETLPSGRWGGCAPGPFPDELLITLWSSDSRSSRGCPPLPRGATVAGGAQERGRGPAIRSARQEVVPHSLRIRCRPLPRVLPGTWVLLSLTFLLARHFRSLKTKISTILVNASLQFGALPKKFLCLSATEKLICSVSYYL